MTMHDVSFVHRSDAADSGLQGRQGLYRRHLKRVLDVVLVVLSAPMALPLVAVLAFINLSLGHAPFFTQARVGKDGRVFRMWKLRTMVVNADRVLEDILANDPVRADEWRHHQKLRNDPRVTPFGSFLRRTSLDELPQLWNVLIGDMSLVGPRPMLPQQRALYHGDAYFRLRPGVTGLWQVRFRNDDGFARRVVCDTQYDRSVTLGTDMALILATVGVLLRPTGH